MAILFAYDMISANNGALQKLALTVVSTVQYRKWRNNTIIGRVVLCWTCDCVVAGSNPARGCCVPTPTQRVIPPWSVNEYTRDRWGVNGHTTRCTRLVSVEEGFGWCPGPAEGYRKRRSAPLYEPTEALGWLLFFYLICRLTSVFVRVKWMIFYNVLTDSCGARSYIYFWAVWYNFFL